MKIQNRASLWGFSRRYKYKLFWLYRYAPGIMGAKHTYYSVLCLFFMFLSYCHAIYHITQSQALYPRQTLVSPSQIFELGFFSPNSSDNQFVGIWYKQISLQRVVVWVANTENPLAVTDSNASLVIGSNGELNLVDGRKRSVWSTNTSVQSNGSVAELSDDGDFLLKNVSTGTILWRSFDHPGNTLVAHLVLSLSFKTGERTVLTSWKSETDPSLGQFTLGLSPKTPPEAFVWINGSIPHWRSGPWDKSKFIGVPDMDSSYLSAFKLDTDIQKGTTNFSFAPTDSTTSLYMFISSQGVLRLMRKDEDEDYWYTEWKGPKNTCEVYGVCGPFAVCNASESPICSCLKGFLPKSSEEWSKGNWTRGCVRQTKLVCDNNTNNSASSGGKKDGFWKKGMMKLPDFYEYVPYEDAESCHTWCWSNCSCLAYAFVNGIGCLVWSKDLIDIFEFSSGGEDLFIRLAPAELDSGGGKQIKKVIISLAAVGTIVILGAIFLAWCRWKANHKGNNKDTTEHFDLIESDTSIDTLQSAKPHDSSELPVFDFDSMLVATNHFSITNKLGQGGFGSVYKGKLEDGNDIAVKRLSSNSGQGIQEFKNEMILISKLQHRNLVKLMGCCTYKEEKLLIYEFMPNKSLDFFLFDPKRRSELNWATRFEIIQGVAKGILYLHRDSSLRVIHRDLKPSNILLDGKMNPKISDFGLARIFQETMDLVNTHRVMGTLGYMSPEYAMGGIFSEKSDVYSFGVLLLEIVSGLKNNSFHYHEEQLSLIAHAWQLWSECRVLELVDEVLADSYPSSEVVRCIHVGLLCEQDQPTDRPTMPEVVIMLCNETDRPKPRRPLFYNQSSSKRDLQPQIGTKCSTNEATVSMIEGR